MKDRRSSTSLAQRGSALERPHSGTRRSEAAFRRAAAADEVAGGAHLSKAPPYRAHLSKEVLFEAVVRDWAAAGRDANATYRCQPDGL